MKLLYLYKWIAGSMTDFTNQFKDNETLYQQARTWWGHLESISIFILLMSVLGICFACFYYRPYNEMPKRHYKPKYWLIFMAITLFFTGLITFLFEYIAVEPRLQGSLGVELKIAIGNAMYATLLYFVTSVIWCNWLPTNAYRLLKF